MSASKHVNPLPLRNLFSLVSAWPARCCEFCPECSAAKRPRRPGPPLTPLPQAPAPQHNAHPYSDQDYSRGKKQLPNPFVVYTVREVAPLNVTNSGRIDQPPE